MSLLAPLFLLGCLAVGLPIIFHLIRRTTREKTAFGSLMFLRPSPPRLTRRSRLEHLLLLALRCVVIALLALGFSRPFFRKAMPSSDPGAGSRKIVLLLDTSASMRRLGLWQSARSKADSILASAAPSDQVAIYTFDRQLHPVMSFEDWNRAAVGERSSLASRKLADTSPGWAATRLGDALISAAELLSDASGTSAHGPRQIIVLSDVQEGSRPEQLQGYEWPKGIDVEIDSLKPAKTGNASLHLVTESDVPETKASTGIRLRVSNSSDSKREQFKVGWAQSDGRTFSAKPIDVYVPPGQSRIVNLTPAESPSDRVILQGDDDDFDNTVFVAAPERSQVRVTYFGSEAENDPRQSVYFIERAFQQTARQAIQVVISSPSKPATDNELGAAGLLIASRALPSPMISQIRSAVASGKTLLFALSAADDRQTLAAILGLADVTLKEARTPGYVMLSEIDFRDPIFAPFADPRFSDFTKIHFWKYRALNASEIRGSRVIAKFDTGDPALLELTSGKGRILILTSTWRPDDSQLALSTKFVPLLYGLLEQSSGPPPLPTQYYVGDSIPIGSIVGNTNSPLTVSLADGSQLKLGGTETNFSATMTPGIYAFTMGDKKARFAVNVDPAESRLSPVSLDDFERLGVPMAKTASAVSAEVARKIQLQNAELENRQKLWRWFLLGTIAVLLGETWLAGRTARQIAVQGGAA